MTGIALLIALALANSPAAVPKAEATPSWRGLVVVLVSPTDDDVTRNALARITGELAAAPFRTITLPIDPDTDVLSQVQTAGDEQSATATFAIVRDRDLGSNRVTIWVSSRVTGTTTIRRMLVEGGNVDRSATRLAVESVELIRASLAGLWPSPPVPSPPETFTPAPPSGPEVAVALGIGRMTDFGDAPAFWAPQLAASWGRPDRVGVRLTASGFGPGADVSSGAGSVHIARAVATLGPFPSLGANQYTGLALQNPAAHDVALEQKDLSADLAAPGRVRIDAPEVLGSSRRTATKPRPLDRRARTDAPACVGRSRARGARRPETDRPAACGWRRRTGSASDRPADRASDLLCAESS